MVRSRPRWHRHDALHRHGGHVKTRRFAYASPLFLLHFDLVRRKLDLVGRKHVPCQERINLGAELCNERKELGVGVARASVARASVTVVRLDFIFGLLRKRSDYVVAAALATDPKENNRKETSMANIAAALGGGARESVSTPARIAAAARQLQLRRYCRREFGQ